MTLGHSLTRESPFLDGLRALPAVRPDTTITEPAQQTDSAWFRSCLKNFGLDLSPVGSIVKKQLRLCFCFSFEEQPEFQTTALKSPRAWTSKPSTAFCSAFEGALPADGARIVYPQPEDGRGDGNNGRTPATSEAAAADAFAGSPKFSRSNLGRRSRSPTLRLD